MDGLMGHRECPGDHGLGGDDGGRGGQHHHRQAAPVRHEQEERTADRVLRVVHDQCTLAEVAEDAGREDQDEPGPGDRGPAEVTEVGVQGLGSRDRQHDAGEGEEGDMKLTEQETPARTSATEPPGSPDAGGYPPTPQAAMAVNHTIMIGPKRRPTRAVPNRWAANSPTMITAVMGMIERFELRLDHLETLDRRQDRDRRGDHAVTEEQ